RVEPSNIGRQSFFPGFLSLALSENASISTIQMHRMSKVYRNRADETSVRSSRSKFFPMFAIIGFVVVLGAVAGGYLMEHGKLAVLVQPAELVIIGGAALGTLLIANPMATLIKIANGLVGVLKGSKYDKAFYTATLKMLNDLFLFARKNGTVQLEEEV